MNELGPLTGINWAVVWGTVISLLLFGVLFNWLTLELSRRGHTEGYTWLLVVTGVAVTVIAAGFTIGWINTGFLFMFFAASGLPMAVGDIWRHVQARRMENGGL